VRRVRTVRTTRYVHDENRLAIWSSHLDGYLGHGLDLLVHKEVDSILEDANCNIHCQPLRNLSFLLLALYTLPLLVATDVPKQAAHALRSAIAFNADIDATACGIGKGDDRVHYFALFWI
jgi:hypothetical protein